MERFQFIINWAKAYWGTNVVWILCLILGAWVLFKSKKDSGKVLFYYICAFCIVYFCPLTAWIITRLLIDEFVYWRLFWVLPVPVILGFCVVELSAKAKKGCVKNLIAALCLCVLVVSGTCVYGKGQFVKATNLFKVPQKVVAACQIMRDNQEEGEMLKAVGDYDFMCYMRQYDAGIYQPYGRYEPGYELGIIIKQEMEKGAEADISVLTDACQNCRTNYIIYKAEGIDDQKFAKANYFPIGTVEDYTIFKFGNYVPEKLS